MYESVQPSLKTITLIILGASKMENFCSKKKYFKQKLDSKNSKHSNAEKEKINYIIK